MCGIFVAFSSSKIEKEKNKYFLATECTHHRGPDNTGFFENDFCFMGHNRLSIIGLESSSNQPYEEKDHVIVYNGEIFNYLEIKDELKNLGYSFKTSSDTEVVLKSYIEWGSNAFNRFNGMWSLAIYNKKNNSLVISRDRFGQKPLFISENKDTFFISSEPQQLGEVVKIEPNFETIRSFVREGGYNRINGNTFFDKIEEFPKAHYCHIDSSNKKDLIQYWNYPQDIKYSNSYLQTDYFNELLKDSVDLRLRADVDVGLLISGGVDSTIIASLVREKVGSNKNIYAYCYSSDDSDDESEFARKVSNQLNLKTKYLKQDRDSLSYINRLKKIVKNLGRGHSSPAIVSIDYLYEHANKDGLKVILDGQGADELLAGYKLYHFDLIFQQLMKLNFKQSYLNLKDFLRVSKQFSYGGLNGSIIVTILFIRERMPKFIKSLMRRIFGYEKLISNKKIVRQKSIFSKKINTTKNSNRLNRFLINQHSNGLENLLYYGDIVAMNNSVENRSPFMDHRLIELAFSSDEYLKVYNGHEKYALRKNKHYLKFFNTLNRDKIGFSSNIRKETKKHMANEILESKILNWDIFNGEEIRKWISSGKVQKSKYERILFRIYQVHLWNQLFIVEKQI